MTMINQAFATQLAYHASSNRVFQNYVYRSPLKEACEKGWHLEARTLILTVWFFATSKFRTIQRMSVLRLNLPICRKILLNLYYEPCLVRVSYLVLWFPKQSSVTSQVVFVLRSFLLSGAQLLSWIGNNDGLSPRAGFHPSVPSFENVSTRTLGFRLHVWKLPMT